MLSRHHTIDLEHVGPRAIADAMDERTGAPVEHRQTQTVCLSTSTGEAVASPLSLLWWLLQNTICSAARRTRLLLQPLNTNSVEYLPPMPEHLEDTNQVNTTEDGDTLVSGGKKVAS